MKRYLSILLCTVILTACVSCVSQPDPPSGGSSAPTESVPSSEVPSGSEESGANTSAADNHSSSSGSAQNASSEDGPGKDPSEQASSGTSSEEPSPVSANEPSDERSEAPSEAPSETPSEEPSGEPSDALSDEPSDDPSSEPSEDSSEQSEDSQPDPPAPTQSNVLLGRKYTVGGSGYRTDSYGDFNDAAGNSCRYRLTDGQQAESGASEAIAGYNAEKISFYFDLGEEMELLEWSTDLWGGQWGIGTPDQCTVSVYWSVDGKKYNLADSATPASNAISTVGDFKKGAISRSFKEPVSARYIRVDYNCKSFVWTSELQLIGKEQASDKAIPRVNIITLNQDRVHKSAYHQCTLQIVDPSGEYKTILDSNAQIKVRGNSTSSGAKQPYNIKFESKQNVLGMGSCKKWYLLANMYDKTQLRNKLSFDLADDIGMAYVQQSTFVRVFLNGEYRGIYQLCESIGTGDSRVDINPNKNEFLLEFEPWPNYANDNWIRSTNYNILLGFNEPDVPTDAQRAWLKEFFRKAESAISSRNITEIEKYLDVDSFIDAFLVEEFFKEVDYQTSSTRFYIKDGTWYAGPVWDFDLSAGNCSSSYYTGYNNVGGSGNSWEGFYCMGLWNSYLFKTKEIKERTVARFKEIQPYIVNLYQDNELGKCKIDALLERFRDEIDLNYTVWSTSEIYSDLERIPSDGTYDGEITYLKKWLKNRNEWLLNAFETSF